MGIRAWFLSIVLTPWVAPLVAETISGRVTTEAGVSVEQARVKAVTAELEAFTDENGAFTIEGCALPCVLVVLHPRFAEQAVDVVEPPTEPLVITLRGKNAFSEQIVVSAERGGGDTFAPQSIVSTVVRAEEKVAAPASLTELVEGVAGVAENGQGGLFQVVSIRGVSRQRLMTLVDGMQMTSERRAGISTSFIDPLLMGDVDVLRGPASTYYGSGALGGVMQIFPRKREGWSLDLGYDAHGDEAVQAIGWGGNGWSIGLARREKGDDEDAAGTEQPTRFTQWSATIEKNWETDLGSWQFLAIPARGTDIGKPNAQLPDRATVYPEENHLLLKLGLDAASGWRFDVWAHPQDLETETTRVGNRVNLVTNEAFDLGASWQRDWRRGALHGVIGVDYFGRRGVEAVDRETRFADGSTRLSVSLDGAERDDVALFASSRWHWGSASMQAGARFTYHQEDNRGFDRENDQAWSGFLGLVQPLGTSFELAANVGTGLRFPTLSERFFTGTTGRGDVISNPNLDPERALNVDVALRYISESVFMSAGVFRQDIDDYIERIEVEDGVRTFVNLTSGVIDGFEIEGFYQPNDIWQLSWSAHRIEGDADDGTSLADIPPARVQLGLRWRDGRWQAQTEYQYRFEKDDPGDGEQAIDDTHLVSASVRYALRDDLALTLRGRNLLDETYLNSADDVAVPSPGRSVGLAFSWTTP